MNQTHEPTPAGLRAQIALDESEIGSALEALRQRVVVVLDWREWVRRKPALALAGAFVLGFGLAARGLNHR